MTNVRETGTAGGEVEGLIVLASSTESCSMRRNGKIKMHPGIMLSI